MKTKRILFGLLILFSLSCNYVTQMFVPPTATPSPTFTATVTVSPTPTATPLVPAFIPPQCEAQPIATTSPEIAIQPTQKYETVEISQRVQLRILRQIENIVEDVYVYPDFNGKDWPAIVARYRAMVEEGLDTDTFYFEMYNMISELEDEHSSFNSPVGAQLSEDELQGDINFVGIGVYSNVDFDRERLVVISTFPGSPAEYAGIQSHDSIIAVDGFPVTRDGGIRTLGPECTAVIVTVQSPGEAPRDVILMRSEIEGNIPIDARLVSTTDGSKIGYISIPSFFDLTIPQQVEDALTGFGELDGLILDVRWNGGGADTVTIPILEFFVDGDLGNFVSRTRSSKLSVRANPIHNSQTVPLVVMVSEDTVSFGEIFSGLLRDARDAKIVGQTSLGNVEVLHGYDFEDGSVMWIAAVRFDSFFSDDDWEETGIVPDVQAFADWDTFYFETDPAIAASLELLGHE